MLGCLILSHGDLAQAYLNAAKQIIGECKNLFAIDCQGFAPRVLYEEVARLIESENLKDGLFIFVSLRGGSCWNVAAKIVRDYDKVELISGVNLSAVLSFLTKRDYYAFEEFAEVLMQDAIRGISRFQP